MAPAADQEPHSAAYFDAVRDYWWNLDHLALIVERLGLGAVRSVLDVGAGVGHWGRNLSSVLSSETMFAGVDREPEWVCEATRFAQQHGLGDRFSYGQGVAEALPLPDASFDLVTCQTLLIHVRDPRAVLREMLRVAKPGGWVLLAEPNNFAHQAIGSSVTAEAPVEEILDRLRFALTCERGKAALGEGNISVGDLLPGYLAEVGAVQIQVFTSDKASAMFPPYESDEQRALCAAVMEDAADQRWVWSRAEARRYFLAGGGTDDAFGELWPRRLAEVQRAADAIANSSFHSAGGVVQYVIAGRRAVEGG